MKKAVQYFALFSIVFLTLTSCSSDDNSSATSAVLLKKMQAGVMGNNEEYQFNYKDTRLTKISYEIDNGIITQGYSKIVYTGNLISEVKDYNNNNINTFNTVFTYNATGQLTEVLKSQVGVDHAERDIFTYNSDNTVNSEHFVGTATSQTTLTASEKFYFQNNLLTQKDYSYYGTLSSQVEYTYDTANHPMKNVTGIDAIKLYVNSFDGFLSLGLKGMSNNIVKETTHIGATNEVVNFETVYNNKNYPVSINSTVDSPGPYSYNYEYYN